MRREDQSGPRFGFADATIAGGPVRLLIIEARFYQEIADELAAGATLAAEEAGADVERIAVPGALEIPQALNLAIANNLVPRARGGTRFDAVVALGCVIRGETGHYDIVCNNANHWLMDIALRHDVPVGNGILTVETMAQALERARGGSAGKGGDAARAALALVGLHRSFQG